MTPRDERERSRESTTPRFPDTNPPESPSKDYALPTLQAVIEMQRTLGELNQAVKTLTVQSNNQGEKIDKISHRVYAATAVVTVLTGIAYFFLNKIFDVVVNILNRPIPPHSP